jgi:CheY-like chemotaxis protein
VLKTAIFDIILLDIEMQNITGEEFTQLKSEFESKRLVNYISFFFQF